MKFPIFLARLVLALALVAIPTGCSSPSGLLKDGDVVSTPPQWVEFCERNPGDPMC
jgi:hypothetical protein